MSVDMQKRTVGPVVDAEWVTARLTNFADDDPSLRLVEVDMNPEEYDEWHLPGAIGFDWEADLAGTLGRDIIEKDAFEDLMAEHGITEESTVVIYGDQANWFAAHAYWLFTYYGHDDVCLLDGGRHYWQTHDLPTTDVVPEFSEREYEAQDPDETIRAYRPDIETGMDSDMSLIDVRSPDEYRGRTAPPGAAETINFDGTFKPTEELAEIYDDVGMDGDEAVTYCRIGERSSLTWFVLYELLDRDAANYDGSWTDGANSDAPVARGE
jgi:thiosulfate/3-mercaptopyruvate sulfurtransferase